MTEKMEIIAAEANSVAKPSSSSSSLSSSSSSVKYKYVTGERRPIEVLVIVTAPEHVAEFIALDHEIWTLGEANSLPDTNEEGSHTHGGIPFISKDVWLHDNRPGEITLVFTWESQSHWDRVDNEALQKRLQAQFDSSFKHPYTMTRLPKDPLNVGLHRISRFERDE